MRITKHHEKHAIERVLFSVSFDEPWDTAAFATADQLYQSELKRQFPRRTANEGILLQFGPGVSIQPQSVPGQISMVRYERYREDGNIKSGVLFEGNMLQSMRSDYESWSKTWSGETLPLFVRVLQACANSKKILSLQLDYVDKFYLDGDLTKFHPSMVLNEGSPYLAPHVFKQTKNWHSYTGFFDDVAEPEPITILNRFNVDFLDLPPEGDRDSTKCLRITGQHVAIFPNPIEVMDLLPNDGQRLNSVVEKLHKVHKYIFGDIVNADVARDVGLSE